MRPEGVLDRSRGLRLLVVYKTAKGALEIALGLVLGFALRDGAAAALERALHRNLSAEWAERLLEPLLADVEGAAIHLVAAALALDGLLGLFEGWILHTGRTWAEWLVVASTGSLIPFEIAAILERPSPVRAALLAVNVATVLYLVARLRRRRAALVRHVL